MKTNMMIAVFVILGVLQYTMAWKCDSYCNADAHICMTSCKGFTGCQNCARLADDCRSTCRRKRTITQGLRKRFQLKNEDTQ